jgi:hypothetical protein
MIKKIQLENKVIPLMLCIRRMYYPRIALAELKSSGIRIRLVLELGLGLGIIEQNGIFICDMRMNVNALFLEKMK